MSDPFLPPQRVGFVGLGNMGAPMAARLAGAGYAIVAADASTAALERFAGRVRCERAGSLADLARSCRVVITMLPDGRTVRAVLQGATGIAAALAPDAIVIDMSSSEPVATRSLAAELAGLQLTLIDAPVSGGVKRAIDGTLAIMVGGDAQAIARCRPLLEAMGRVFPTGGSGSGHAMKALNNYLSALALAGTAEAMIAGEKFGLEPRVMLEVLNHSTGRNTATEQKYPAFVLSRSFDSGFALALMAKDLRIALGLAGAVGSAAPLLERCSGLYDEAQRCLGPAADNTDIVRFLEALHGEVQ